MKLYLSSYRVPTPGDLVQLVGKPPVETRLAIIPNAKDYHLPQDRAAKLDELSSDLQKIGFAQTEVMDLRDYDNGEQAYEALRSSDVIWAAGGNSFVLRAEIRRSGLEQVLTRLLEEGKVYGGESAGAIVAGLTLQGCEVGDDPDLADQTIWEGLGLVQRIIAPHADSVDHLEYVNHMKKLYKDSTQVLYLNDNQALVINDNEERLVAS
jgi:dipeptidase E